MLWSKCVTRVFLLKLDLYSRYFTHSSLFIMVASTRNFTNNQLPELLLTKPFCAIGKHFAL